MAIAYVNDTGLDTAGPVASDICSWGVLPTVGNHVFVLIAGWEVTQYTNNAVTDNQGNSYVENVEGTHTGGGRCSASIYSTKVATSSGTYTMTADPTPASGNYLSWCAIEFSGCDATTWLHKTGTNNSATGDANVTASAANTTADCLVLAACAVSNNDTDITLTVPTTGYTRIAVQQNPNATIGFDASYKIVSATETSAATWTHDNTSQSGWAAAIATYAAAAGGASIVPILMSHYRARRQ